MSLNKLRIFETEDEILDWLTIHEGKDIISNTHGKYYKFTVGMFYPVGHDTVAFNNKDQTLFNSLSVGDEIPSFWYNWEEQLSGL